MKVGYGGRPREENERRGKKDERGGRGWRVEHGGWRPHLKSTSLTSLGRYGANAGSLKIMDVKEIMTGMHMTEFTHP